MAKEWVSVFNHEFQMCLAMLENNLHQRVVHASLFPPKTKTQIRLPDGLEFVGYKLRIGS